jgi:hypothetical protein
MIRDRWPRFGAFLALLLLPLIYLHIFSRAWAEACQTVYWSAKGCVINGWHDTKIICNAIRYGARGPDDMKVTDVRRLDL